MIFGQLSIFHLADAGQIFDNLFTSVRIDFKFAALIQHGRCARHHHFDDYPRAELTPHADKLIRLLTL